jgi:Acetoacetate decarboxylase (ADC)
MKSPANGNAVEESPLPAPDGATVLEPDSALPSVPRQPAPWQLHASAYVLAVLVPEDVLDKGGFVPAHLLEKRRSRVVCAMFVDYESTNCGPYQELLLAPTGFAFESGVHPSITRIYVSSYDSVVNGRKNWGIPKDRAEFERERDEATSTDHIRVSRDSHVFAELELRAYGPALPTATWFIPKAKRTLIQHWQGQSYRFTLSATGRAQVARVLSWRFDAAFFPDLARGRVLAASYLPRFEMTFPAAEIQAL